MIETHTKDALAPLGASCPPPTQPPGWIPTIVLERQPDESTDEWERMIAEMEASEAVFVWRFTDGSIGLKHRRQRVSA